MHKRILTMFTFFVVGVILTASYAIFSPDNSSLNAQTSNPSPTPTHRKTPSGSGTTNQRVTPSSPGTTNQRMTPASPGTTNQRMTPASPGTTNQRMTPASPGTTNQRVTPASPGTTNQRVTPASPGTNLPVTPSDSDTNQRMTPSSPGTKQLGTPTGSGADEQMTPSSPGTERQTAPGPQANDRINEIDRIFFEEAAQNGLGNIQLGQLALQKSKSEAVKNFANAEIQEQVNIKNNLTRLAPQMGMTLPTTPSEKHQASLARLSALSGEDFDRAYMDEGGVNTHLENAALFQREAAFGQNPELVSLATNGLPTIKRHFTIASNATNYQFAQVARNYRDTSTSSSR